MGVILLPCIAIDGPAACGKTTVALQLAKLLGLVYLDTGAMYRACAWKALQEGINVNNEPDTEKAIIALVEHLDLQVLPSSTNASGHRIIVDGQDITSVLHSAPVTQAVSSVAKISAVRREMVRRQQAIAALGGVVMAGRDICTVVLPQARLKYYLDASIAERARRRWQEVAAEGRNTTMEEIAAQLAARDESDSQRADSPLVIAPDAVRIDSTNISAEEIARLIAQDYQRISPKR